MAESAAFLLQGQFRHPWPSNGFMVLRVADALSCVVQAGSCRCSLAGGRGAGEYQGKISVKIAIVPLDAAPESTYRPGVPRHLFRRCGGRLGQL